MSSGNARNAGADRVTEPTISRTSVNPTLLQLKDERIGTLRRTLVKWFSAHRRDLPWRRTRDAYAIWISEAMLQQTRVETVIPYFRRFLERFPTVGDLAASTEDEAVALWSGLGYYRRVRALREAAGLIVERHGGRFPDCREDLLALPGVGPYTAGAVLSIAFGQPEPLVDGNVARVFSRLFGLTDPIGSTALTRELWALSHALVPARDPGAWNQAVMELGALICTPRAPSCARCPLADECVARVRRRTEELPVPARKRASVPVLLELALVQRGERVLLTRRPGGGRMPGMWELPTREVPGPDGGLTGLWPPVFPCVVRLEDELSALSHAITHHRIRARVRRAELGDRGEESVEWFEHDRLADLGVTGMTRKALHLRNRG